MEVKTDWVVETIMLKGVPAKRAYRSDGASVIPYMMPSGKIRYTPTRPNGGCFVTEGGSTKRYATLAKAQTVVDRLSRLTQEPVV